MPTRSWTTHDVWQRPVTDTCKSILYVRGTQPPVRGDIKTYRMSDLTRHMCSPQVPLDGVVAHGSANVSLQHISGESHPVRVAVGSTVPAGSLNTDGLLVVRVASLSTDSTPARIARLTAQAQVGCFARGCACEREQCKAISAYKLTPSAPLHLHPQHPGCIRWVVCLHVSEVWRHELREVHRMVSSKAVLQLPTLAGQEGHPGHGRLHTPTLPPQSPPRLGPA